jgi:hypothetical protein
MHERCGTDLNTSTSSAHSDAKQMVAIREAKLAVEN